MLGQVWGVHPEKGLFYTKVGGPMSAKETVDRC